MVGVMFCCSVDNPEAIHTSWEHSEARWVTLDEAIMLLPEDHWLIQLIQQAERLRALIPAELLAYYRERESNF